MIDVFIKYWDRLSRIGIHQYLKTEQQQKIVLVNRTSIISALLNTLALLVFGSVLIKVNFFYVALAFSFLYISTLFFNYIRLYYLAAVYLFMLYVSAIFLLSSTLGYESNVHFLYIITLFSLITGFGISNRALLITLISVPILFLIVLYITDFSLLKPSYLPANIVDFTNLIVTTASICGVVLLSYMYVSISKKNNKMLKQEIAEREKNEYLLRQSETKLKALIENTVDNIWSVDTNFRLISLNTSFAKTVKKVFKIEIKAGDHIFDGFPTYMQEFWKPLYQRAFAGNSFKIEWSYFNEPLSKTIEVETQISPIRNDKNEVQGATFFSRDVTQRKESERLIKQKDQLLHAINHNIKVGIFRSSVSKGAIYINQAYVRMFGYNNMEEILKIPYKNLYANDADRIKLINDLSEKKNIDNEEILFKRRDGSTFWGLVSAILTRDESNNEHFFDGTIRDITELKNIQFQLEKAKAIAEQSSLDKSQFLSSMSHEIRTPLNAIIGLTHLLSEEEPKPEQIENLNTLSFSAQNLLVLINDILDFNKIEAGKIVLEKIDFNLRELLKNIKHGFQIAADENKNNLILSIDEHLPHYIKGDPTRLSQILTNLVGNAVKFTKNGKININVKLIEKNKTNVAILFAVADTGIGIPKEKQHLIFDGFTQATSETTRKYGGTGLGLAITKKLLEMQNSQITLESEEGKGATFSFILKAEYSDEKQETEIKPTQNIFHSFEKQRVLVVEDNLANQLVAKKFLTKWGLNVTIAEDGLIALKLLSYQDFDLILMDIQMPNMNGYEATRAIRKMEKYRKLPIIALTASVHSGIGEKALDAGMNDYVLKPFEPSQLYQKIALWLSKN